MQIDIPAHIEKLLFLHEALVIPGFGGFTATRTPATADYVGGTVSSPAKTLSFSENLTIDDGILINDIVLTHGISTEDAKRVVDEFVDKMQSLLSQREIVTLPGVGRLYKNYVQKIQFLPDATNFNAASYGLPPLQFSPIARSREVTPDAKEIAASTTNLPPTKDPGSVTPPPMPEATYSPERKKTSYVGATFGIIFLLASLTAAIWYWQSRKNDKAQKDLPKTEENATTNSQEEQTSSTVANTKEPEVIAPEKTTEESVQERMNAAREQVKNGKLCILVVATLSKKENADKLESLLKEEGFDVYTQHRSSHQVGIQFYYTSPSEIEEKKATLSQLTGVHNIVVKRK
ncbi:MAG: hypothetical protein R3A50_08595 [Saprospiraceae bacterium]